MRDLRRFRSTSTGALAVAAALGATSCTDEVDHTLRDQGAVCLVPNGEEVERFACEKTQLPAGEVLRLRVDFETCLSSSCDELLQASCRATVEGSIISVTAEATIRSGGDACTDDCQAVLATCDLGPLPAGDYELRYAGSSLPLSLPSTRSRLCTEPGFGPICCDVDADCAEGSCGELNNCFVPE